MKELVFATCLLVSIAPCVAHAEEKGSAPSDTDWASSRSTPDEHEEARYPIKIKPRSEPTHRWYGYMTLLADGLSIALYAGGESLSSGPAAGAGAESFIVASPVIHLAHGRYVPGLVGLPVRAAGLFTGGLLGFSESQCQLLDEVEECRPEVITRGIVIAASAMAIIDAAFLAYMPIERRHADGHWVPRVAFARGEGALIVQGAF